ncbi:AAA family ATPase [Phascolarctobacterium succinatutens]|uniref:AAA family ATPase n=1 Tax=Phascolarctobacterium succinatutens TaxID=626940 RepID=UPI0026ED375E|nr:AAA family ATPase [Phascolarctobacterium succinatutens]
MAYTSGKAVEVIEGYFNEINASYELIDNSKKRGFLVKIDDASKIVIFVSPLVHKVDGTKNYFDTRDSAPDARELVWNYAQKNNYKFFHLGINDEVPKYKDYIFSLEADEDYVQKFSGTEHGERVGPGNQVIIPNDFIPAKNFERINNRALIYISVIHKSFLKEYLTFYDNRPYSGTDIPDQNENEITADNKLADNFLLYGVPGCGKSFYVEKHYESKVEEGFTIRVVFHPDYTYSDFVGQVMPILKTIPNEQGEDEKKLQYEFVPGPFTQILHTAYLEPEKQCLLIIEELNRGNAPAIFGEIFQLLDRNDNGESKYGIYNADIAKYAYTDLTKYDGWQEEAVAKESIKLPPNLTIVATMNTSDQNVFTMDTAFQRRWQMKHIPNRFTGESLDEKTINHVAKHLPNSEISWGAFAQTVNKKMHTANLGFGSTEDKSLGVYFATDNDLDEAERFAEKVLKYLWDDAFKLGRKELFNDCSQGLSAVIEAYEDAAKAKIEKQSAEDPLKKVLVPEVYNEMQKKMAEMVAEQAQTAEEKTSEEEAAKSAAEDNPAQKPAGEE